MDISEAFKLITDNFGEILTGILGIFGGFALLRKKMAEGESDINKINTETDIIGMLRDELNTGLVRTRELELKISDLTEKNSHKDIMLSEFKFKKMELEVEIEELNSKIALLDNLVNRLSSAIDTATDRINTLTEE